MHIKCKWKFFGVSENCTVSLVAMKQLSRSTLHSTKVKKRQNHWKSTRKSDDRKKAKHREEWKCFKGAITKPSAILTCTILLSLFLVQFAGSVPLNHSIIHPFHPPYHTVKTKDVNWSVAIATANQIINTLKSIYRVDLSCMLTKTAVVNNVQNKEKINVKHCQEKSGCNTLGGKNPS